MKKTHLKLQNVGEVEDKKSVELDRSSSEGRRMMKQFRGRHKEEFLKGDDPRSNAHLIESKAKKLMDK